MKPNRVASCFLIVLAVAHSRSRLLRAADAGAIDQQCAYRVVFHHASDGASWTQNTRVEITPTATGLTVTLRDAKLTIEQATAAQRAVIDKSSGGHNGASATVNIDDRGNILSVANVSSPPATDARLPVSEGIIRRIAGLCILALPSTADPETMAVGDSWPADYRTGIGERRVNIHCR